VPGRPFFPLRQRIDEFEGYLGVTFYQTGSLHMHLGREEKRNQNNQKDNAQKENQDTFNKPHGIVCMEVIRQIKTKSCRKQTP
jgi:hypothetical protein